MNFKPINRLEVRRKLSTGQELLVGTLAQNRQGVFFQYDQNYLSEQTNLSPFVMQHDHTLQQAPMKPHNGLHGVFADALPDGWGLLLQDRVFRQNGIMPAQVTAMDRLAFVGSTAMGALKFSPVSEYGVNHQNEIDIQTLGFEAQAFFDKEFDKEFDGQTDDVLAALVAAGSSGGARPKAQVYFENGDTKHCSTQVQSHENNEAWLVKFTSKNLSLGHEEGLCEAAYLTLAEDAGLQPPQWQLLDAPKKSGARQWLALKRFDCVNQANSTSGRLHMHSACGLLNADFRVPSLDYEDLIKASRILCKSPAAGQMQFKRAMFNLFSCNQDDHSKNWAFLQADNGEWNLAPFYDVTFSPHPFGEQSTSFAGFGKNPPLQSIQKLASTASFANWSKAKQVVEEVVSEIQSFSQVAKELGVKAETIRLIQKQLDATWQANKILAK
ncbi:type II toxin-antitoxin system HipA family toxin [Shewanella sp. 202IG2-18]|uniref:type II toxin-antitoxin system HipA family toxin n=1 Tax=Parashewanella hymeniacidonis TaxID=2807618 RepID=UPI0019610BD9|nr:type II toxin-antitoxin system HipA family toxin [Parashewanella hymeniacidonis]MBM7073586.1 type II toxin-antitoxin system HipA family toxin [Parashewanella hymeniacidonis]